MKTEHMAAALSGLAIILAGQWPQPAAAQEAAPAAAPALQIDTADEDFELPPVIVQGTTLDATPQVASQPAAAASGAVEAPATAAKEAQPSSGQGALQGLATTGSAVSVVTGAELQAQQIRHPADALRSLPGVEVSRTGSFGGLTQVRIRGAEANHTLVVIDGIEGNATTDGAFDFGNLLADDIERIEVIRGPQSGLYGANAVGGVVNIVTRDGRGPAQIRVRGEGGSFGSAGVATSLSGGTDEAHGILSFQKRKDHGFNIAPFGGEDDGSDITNAFAKGGVEVLPWLNVDAVLRQDENESDRDTDGLPLDGGPYYVQTDVHDYFNTRNRLAGVDATATLLDGHWVQHFRANYSDTRAKDISIDYGLSQNDGNRTDLSYVSTLKGDAPSFLSSHHAVTALLEHKEEGFIPVTADDIERTRNTDSYALEYRGQFLDQFDLTATVRHDDNDSFEDFDSYRVAGSWQIPNTPLRAHSSVGTGDKAPTMFELYGYVPSLFVPNPDLKPEESFGWDAGMEASLLKGSVVVDVTYFDQDLKNEIATAYVGSSSTAVNLDGTSDRSGTEVSAAWQVTQGLTVSGAYTHLDAFDPQGVREVRRPEHAGRVDVDYRFADDRANLHLGVIYNGTMEDTAFAIPFYTPTLITLDAYTLVELAASYELKPGVQLFARAENLLDEDYQEVYGYETPGAAVFGGMKFTFGGDGL